MYIYTHIYVCVCAYIPKHASFRCCLHHFDLWLAKYMYIHVFIYIDTLINIVCTYINKCIYTYI